MTNYIEKLTGKDLIAAGFEPGHWFSSALDIGNAMLEAGVETTTVMEKIDSMKPAPHLPLKASDDITFYTNIHAENEHEQENIDKVKATMTEVMRTPVVKAGSIMPDACPAGPIGTIPVGGIAASEAIHPGMHSADICCSMSISIFKDADPCKLLDSVHEATHFGPGERSRSGQIWPETSLLQKFEENSFLKGLKSKAIGHFATQGDGNHFAYVGTIKSTGETALVTHHGSRAPGAMLYKRGMAAAERFRMQYSRETLPQNAWIPADSYEGEEYWSALQIIREWTKQNHRKIHDMAAQRAGFTIVDQFWNEHNFVFRKSDGLFYHGKGATPAFKGWADDATDLTLIPLNMAEPILIARGKNAKHGLGFAPHGAGRNYSRTQHKRMNSGRTDEEIFAEETKHIDARFYCKEMDISELPSAYKNASAVRKQIKDYDLAEVVDEVLPYGCIMAGDWEKNAPWRKKRARKAAKNVKKENA